MENIDLSELIKRLNRAAAAVAKNRALINSINVFPVPDSDTGNNMAVTFEGIKNALQKKSFKDISDLSKTALDAALISSQGNSGLIMTSFLSGFLGSFETSEISAKDLKIAFEKGAVAAKKSVENPKKGTMLDVAFEFAKSFNRSSVENALKAAKNSLIQTESKMKVLSENHVVDAGALGFTFFLFGFFGKSLDYSKMDVEKMKLSKVNFGKFFYEVIFIISSSEFKISEIREMFHPMGDSLDIVSSNEKIKVHIHTNEPKLVIDTAKLLGKMESIRSIDMRKEATHP